MSWPLASDYQDAIQNPDYCFQEANLQTSQVVCNKLGLPCVASGTFASVYEMHRGPQRYAVRCFLRANAAHQNRYALRSQYVDSHRMPELVDFTYKKQGIKVGKQWYPIVIMEWVAGETLHTYIGKHLHETATLHNLAVQWRNLLTNLKTRHIAHADLQHGNILVTADGALRLVDYDSMYVPLLAGQSCYELGHANYQHPERASTDYDEHLDNFSALAIYTSLVALIYDPSLWAQFHTGENLIFSAADYKNTPSSSVFKRLHHIPQLFVRELAMRLEVACWSSIFANDHQEMFAAYPDIPAPLPWWQDTNTVSWHQKQATSLAPFYPLGKDIGITKVISFVEASGEAIAVPCPADGRNGCIMREIDITKGKEWIEGDYRIESGRRFRVRLDNTPDSPSLIVTLMVLPADFQADLDWYTNVTVTKKEALSGGEITYTRPNGAEYKFMIKPFTKTGWVYRGTVPESKGMEFIFVRVSDQA